MLERYRIVFVLLIYCCLQLLLGLVSWYFDLTMERALLWWNG